MTRPVGGPHITQGRGEGIQQSGWDEYVRGGGGEGRVKKVGRGGTDRSLR